MMRMLIWWLLASATLSGQRTVVDFFVDPVGKAYYLLADEQLVTANPVGQNEFAFYDSSLGAPTSVDVTNPFAILLFYADYGTVVLLDRTLSEVSRLDLFAGENVLQPVAAARATDDGLWIFDGWDYRLKLLAPNGDLRLRSNDLRLSLNVEEEPTAIYVAGGAIYVHYPDSDRLALFTNYGRFERWIRLPPADRFGWYAPVLTGLGPETAWTYRSGEAEARSQTLRHPAGRVYWKQQGYYGLEQNGYARLLPFGTGKDEENN